MRLVLVWLINTASLIAALILGLVNAIIRPIVVLLTLPVTVLTLGLFIFVINGLLFWMVGTWIEGFRVSLVSWRLSALVMK